MYTGTFNYGTWRQHFVARSSKPIVVTDAMIEAGMAIMDGPDNGSLQKTCEKIYVAMAAAAPAPAADADQEIDESAVVRLRSGGPAMTVSEVRWGGSNSRRYVARCHWIDENGQGREYTFPVSTLVRQ